MKLLSILITLTAATSRYGKSISGRFFFQAYGWDKGVRFEVTMPEKTYLGFILGEANMWQKDMLIFQAAGVQSQAADYLGVGYRTPEIDMQ